MGLHITKTDETVYNPVFLKILEDITGGITIKTDRVPSGTREIKSGALLNADSSTAGLYNLIKTAKLSAAVASDATIMSVYNNHEFKTGEYMTFAAASGASIVSITASTSTLDVIVIAHQLTTALAGGSVIYEALAGGSSAARYTADAILRDTVEVRNADLTTIQNVTAGAVVRGTVDESGLPYFVTDADKTSLTDRIRFA